MSPRKDVLQTHWPLVTGLLLPITLLLTTLTTSLLQTWTAPLLPATAVQWLVTKAEKDGYFDAEGFNDHSATEFRRDVTHLPWDVWLQQEHDEIKGNLRCTAPGITAPLSALVQRTVTQSGKSVFFDAEEHYEYTAAEPLSEEVRRPWDVWISGGGRQRLGTKIDLQGVTPRPEIPQSLVQRLVLPSDSGEIFEAEEFINVTATELQEGDIFQQWDVWITVRSNLDTKGIKDDLQGVTPGPATSQSRVQRLVLTSDGGIILDAEDSINVTAAELQEEDIFWQWDGWISGHKKIGTRRSCNKAAEGGAQAPSQGTVQDGGSDVNLETGSKYVTITRPRKALGEEGGRSTAQCTARRSDAVAALETEDYNGTLAGPQILEGIEVEEIGVQSPFQGTIRYSGSLAKPATGSKDDTATRPREALGEEYVISASKWMVRRNGSVATLETEVYNDTFAWPRILECIEVEERGVQSPLQGTVRDSGSLVKLATGSKDDTVTRPRDALGEEDAVSTAQCMV